MPSITARVPDNASQWLQMAVQSRTVEEHYFKLEDHKTLVQSRCGARGDNNGRVAFAEVVGMILQFWRHFSGRQSDGLSARSHPRTKARNVDLRTFQGSSLLS